MQQTSLIFIYEKYLKLSIWTMRLLFCMWHKGSVLPCDFIDIHVKFRFSAEPFHSFMGSMSSLELSESWVLHTYIFWVSIGHLLLKIKAHKRTRSWRISSKDSLQWRNWSYQWGYSVHHGHMKSVSVLNFLTAAIKAGIYLSDPQFWVLKNTF